MLTSTGRRLDLPTSGLALLRDRDHWRLLRSEWGDGAGEVEGVAFAADSKNPARMVCNLRFWLVGWLRLRKGSGFSRHRDMTIPLVGQFREPKDLRHASRGYLRDARNYSHQSRFFGFERRWRYGARGQRLSPLPTAQLQHLANLRREKAPGSDEIPRFAPPLAFLFCETSVFIMSGRNPGPPGGSSRTR